MNSDTPKNSKYLTQLTIKLILLHNIHSTNFQYKLSSLLFISLLIILHLSSMNVVPMKFHYCSSTSPHKQPSSLRCSTFFSSIDQHHPSSSLAPSSLPAHSLLQLVFNTSPPTLHCFNWSSQSQRLQLIFTESTASTGLHCFNWSCRHWSFVTRIECFKLH